MCKKFNLILSYVIKSRRVPKKERKKRKRERERKRTPPHPAPNTMASSTKGGEAPGRPQPSRLLRCTIFCRTLAPSDEDAGPEELAEEILYFYPSKTSTQDQLHFVNTCEGFIDFSRTFNAAQPVETVHLDASRLVIHECEPETYLVLEVSSPHVLDEAARKKGSRRSAFGRQKKQRPTFVPAADDLHDPLLYDVASDMYDMYCLFRGPIRMSLFPPPTEGHETDGAITRIQHARRDIRKAKRYTAAKERGDLDNPTEKQGRFIQLLADGTLEKNLKDLVPQSPATPVRHALQTLIPIVQESVSFGHMSLFHSMDGFQFLPVKRLKYLEVFQFVLNVERLHPCVEGVGILYQGHMVWNTLRQEDMRLILKFIRYHDMVGSRNRSMHSRMTAMSGFLSNLRGVYVDPEPVAPAEAAPADADAKEGGEGEEETRKIKSTLFNPPLCIPAIKRNRRYTDEDHVASATDGLHVTMEEMVRIEEDLQARMDGVDLDVLLEKTLKEARIIPGEDPKADQELNAGTAKDMMNIPGPSNARGNKWRKRGSSLASMYHTEGHLKNVGATNSDGGAAPAPQYYRTSQHRLVVYKKGATTLILTVNTGHKSLEDIPAFCRAIKEENEGKMVKLGEMLGEGYEKIEKKLRRRRSAAPKCKYIYFNRLNLALQVELPGLGTQRPKKESKKNRSAMKMQNLQWPLSSAELCSKLDENCPRPVVRAINEVYVKLNEEIPFLEDLREMHVKTANSGWVYGKKSGDRILIVWMEGKLSLIEVQKEVETLLNTVFQSIYL